MDTTTSNQNDILKNNTESTTRVNNNQSNTSKIKQINTVSDKTEKPLKISNVSNKQNPLTNIIDNNVKIKSLNSINESDLQEELNHILDSVDIEHNPDKKQNNQKEDISPDQKQQEQNGGHYEKKKGPLILWGLIACMCILAGPLGGGLAFLFVPAQLSSFLLIPFYKRGTKKVFVADRKSNPRDKLVSAENGKNIPDKALVNNSTNKDFLLENLKEINMEDLNKMIPSENSYINLYKENPKLISEINLFSTLLTAITNENVEQQLIDIFKKPDNKIVDAIKNTNINLSEEIKSLNKLEGDEQKALANKMLNEIKEVVAKVPEINVDLSETKKLSDKIIENVKENEEYLKIVCNDLSNKIVNSNQMYNAKDIQNKKNRGAGGMTI